MADDPKLSRNKAVVARFNRDVIERGDVAAFDEIVAADFVNRTAAAGASPDRVGMLAMLKDVLRPAFADLRVEIHDQVAEGDKVTTRKTIHGTHTGWLQDIEPTGMSVAIQVIDIVRLRDGLYVEHWGINTLPVVMAQLRTGARDKR